MKLQENTLIRSYFALGCDSPCRGAPWLLLVLIGVCLLAAPVQAQFDNGSGTVDDPYLIYTPEQLNSIGDNSSLLDKHFKLMTDIDLGNYTGTEFNIIGSDAVYGFFNGVFDGNGHTVSNFTYNTSAEEYVGLFGAVKGAEVKNLGLINPNIVSTVVSDSVAVGSLAGFTGYHFDDNTTITSCYVQGGSVSAPNVAAAGGLVGFNGPGGTLSDCHATCSVSSNNRAGGLVGINGFYFFTPSAIISNCYATGSVVGSENLSTGSIGGLVGENMGLIFDSYATGNVGGNIKNVGGLVGMHVDYGNMEETATISNCYSTGNVAGPIDVGGLIAETCCDAIVTNSFWDIQTSGQDNSSGGEGKTTAQMQDRATFIDAGWNFVNIWTFCPDVADPDTYPFLAWQGCVLSGPCGGFANPIGDLSEDCTIDWSDFALFASCWLDSGCEDPDWCDGADLDHSGEVNWADFAVFAAHWLESAPPELEMFYNFSLDVHPGWDTSGQWAFGQPTGGGGANGNPDPTSGHTGTNVYGVNLNGNYDTAEGGPYYLTAGPFDCSLHSGVILKFARWLNTDESDYVSSKVEVSTDNSSWDMIWEHTGDPITDSIWQVMRHNISSIADRQATVYIRWSYEIRQLLTYPYSGWNIDDIQLWGD